MVTGCIEPRIVECGSWSCPSQLACGNAAEPCVSPDLVCTADAGCAGGAFCKAGVCTAPVCGNAEVEPGETCDDDRCFECRIEVACGNGDLTPDEGCDDGDRESGDGCSSACGLEQPRWDEVIQLDVGPARNFMSGAYDEARRRFVVFGGASGASSNQTLEYDVAGGVWLDRTQASGPLRGYGATLVYDPVRRVVVMFGGLNTAGYSDKTWIWDGEVWEQRFVAGPPARAFATGIFDPARGTVVIVGGNQNAMIRSDTWEWDGSEWRQVDAVGPVPDRRSAFAYDEARGEGILFIPGRATWRWREGAWSRVENATIPTSNLDASLVFDRARGQLILHSATGTHAFDGERWNDLGIPHPLRQRQTAFFDPVRGQVAVAGGTDVSVEPALLYADIAWLDVTGGRWNAELARPGPGPRTGAGLAYDPVERRLVMYGGVDPRVNASTDDVWVRTGIAWRKEIETGPPGTRNNPGFAYDARRDVFVLYGGRTGDTSVWEWDRTTWTRHEPVSGPPARTQAAFAYDARIEKIVLFGGRTSTTDFDDTWTWDGTEWEDVSGTVRPPRRFSGTLAFSATQDELLLYGGYTDTALGDFWAWDSGGWREIVRPVAPEPRTDHVLARDPWRGEVILFGGRNSSDPRDDTWAWSGTDWQQLDVSAAPPPSSGMSAVYDEGGHRLVLIGREGTWELRWRSERPFDVCETETDFDGDLLAGCADPDCALVCR